MSNFNFGLYIVATPIGNLDDITLRAKRVLEECDFIICENPKHSLKLLNKLDIKKKLISLHDYNEEKVISRVGFSLKQKVVALISDAGSPLISDPGFKLVRYCHENNIYITSIPGANSIIPALQLSSLPLNEFCFLGFYPKNLKQKNEFLDLLKKSERTVVFFVSTNKIKNCLETLIKHINDRNISICKEITKLNERVFRGSPNKVKNQILKNDNNKGEFVVVVEGISLKTSDNFEIKDLTLEIDKLLNKFSLTDVVEIVHKMTKLPKNKIYKNVLDIKNG